MVDQTGGLCERCEREAGHPYTFLYGNKTGHRSYEVGNVIRTTTKFQITGSETALIGDRCISRYRLKHFAILGLPTLFVTAWVIRAVLSLVIGNINNPDELWLFRFIAFVGGFSALVLMVVIYEDFKRSKTDFGERLAIAVREKSLRTETINYFTTNKSWQNIKGSEHLYR